MVQKSSLKMKFKPSKKINKKDLILGKIFELKENDFGDISRLQMIQTYLEEDEKVDQEDNIKIENAILNKAKKLKLQSS